MLIHQAESWYANIEYTQTQEPVRGCNAYKNQNE